MHILEPDREHLHGMFSPLLPPIATIESGDRVRCRTLDVSWGLEARRPDTPWRETVQPREQPRDSGPCLLGPIAVAGAEPGDMLEVHLEKIVPGPWGWTFGGDIGFFNSDLNRRLGVADGDALTLRWEIDVDRGIAASHLGHIVPFRLFLGTLGLCPAPESRPEHLSPDGNWVSAWPPGRTLGNTDCPDLIEGSRLFIPVEVPGALLSLGDGHAAQGDGEISGTAIEVPMQQVDLHITLHKGTNLTGPRAVTPAGDVTFGFAEDLDDAIAEGVNAMLDWMEEEDFSSRKEAIAILSSTADVRISQLVNGVRGVHVVRRRVERIGAENG